MKKTRGGYKLKLLRFMKRGDLKKTLSLVFFSIIGIVFISMEMGAFNADSFNLSRYALETNPPAKLYLYISDSDLAELYARDPRSDELLPAEARFEKDGPVKKLRGIRFRGATARFLPKKSFHIRFDERQEILFDSSRMNANAMYTDPAMMRERLAFEMFHHLGRPAPKTRYFDLWLNNVYEGLYLHVQRVDSTLLEAAGLHPEGTLVRDQFRDSMDPRIDVLSAFAFPLSDFSEQEQVEILSDNFDFRGNPDWNKLAELIKWVQRSHPGQDFAYEFYRRIDADIFIDWLAIHYLIGDIDSFANDYWLYLDHFNENARWVVIPWDKDLSFGSFNRTGHGTANDFFFYEYHVTSAWQNYLIRKFLETPVLRQALLQRMLFLMNNVFHAEYFQGRVELTHKQIADSVSRQPSNGLTLKKPAFILHPGNHHSVQGASPMHNEVILDFVELRYGYLNRFLNPIHGKEYFAQRYLTSIDSDNIILLTDPWGWTIAKLELLSQPVSPGTISIEVGQDAAVEGIDRRWRIMNTASEFDAVLTLYYRNDDSKTEYPYLGNWYTGGEIPVGNQWDLQMAGIFWHGLEQMNVSRVNPFSNKVVARVTISLNSDQEIVVYQCRVQKFPEK